MLFWGLLLGLPVGFLLTLWFGHCYFPLTFWGARFAREQNTISLDLQFMFKKLQQKTEDLAHQIEGVDLELQNVKLKVYEIEDGLSALNLTRKYPGEPVPQNEAAFSPGKSNLPVTGQTSKVVQCRQEIYRLYQEGLSLPEIARQLKIRQGEVELVLFLKRYGKKNKILFPG